MLKIKKIVGLLDNGEACGDADGEQKVIVLMSDNTYRATILKYQEKSAFAKSSCGLSYGNHDFSEWDNCYNLVLETPDKNFNIANVPVVTLGNRSSYHDPLDIYYDYHYDNHNIVMARIGNTKFVLFDL